MSPRRHDQRGRDDRATAPPRPTGRPPAVAAAAQPARPEGVAVPLHRAVLHRVRHLRRSTRCSARSGCRFTTGTWSTRATSRRSSGSTTTRTVRATRTSGTRSATRSACSSLADRPAAALALFLANLLNRPLRARTLFRMAMLLPNATSVAAVGIVFGTLFQRDFGVINWVLALRRRRPGRLARDEWSPWTAIATMVDWRWTGYNALIFLAGMQAIPRDLYESAAIDGAGRGGSSGGSPCRCCARRSCSWSSSPLSAACSCSPSR